MLRRRSLEIRLTSMEHFPHFQMLGRYQKLSQPRETLSLYRLRWLACNLRMDPSSLSTSYEFSDSFLRIFAGPIHLFNNLFVESGIKMITGSPSVNVFDLLFRLYLSTYRFWFFSEISVARISAASKSNFNFSKYFAVLLDSLVGNSCLPAHVSFRFNRIPRAGFPYTIS